MSHKTPSQGFAHVGLIIVTVLVVAAAGFAGWYVWQKNQDDKQGNSTNNTSQSNESDQPEPEPTADETADWVSVTTQGGAFSMKVPDGWKLTKYSADFVGTLDVTYAPGTPAVINTSSTEYAGHSLRFRASVTALDDAGLGPQWASPQPGLQEVR